MAVPVIVLAAASMFGYGQQAADIWLRTDRLSLRKMPHQCLLFAGAWCIDSLSIKHTQRQRPGVPGGTARGASSIFCVQGGLSVGEANIGLQGQGMGGRS